MTDDNNSPANTANEARPRRGSFTQTTFNAIFGGRSNSTSGQPNAAGTAPFPTPINTANSGRRMSITSTLGLGSSPTQSASFMPGRRASISTAGSDSIDESAIEDDEAGRSIPTTPFTRRMSFGAQALFNSRQGGGSPGTSGRTPSYTHKPLAAIPDAASPARRPSQAQANSSSIQASKVSNARNPSDVSSNRSAEGLNWSEQFRSRAESTISRPSFSTSPSSSGGMSKVNPFAGTHERAKSISEMPTPPQTMPAPQKDVGAMRRKPDAIGERMLRGEFYMD